MLNAKEIMFILEDPRCLLIAADYNENQATMADSMGFEGSVKYHEDRKKELMFKYEKLYNEGESNEVNATLKEFLNLLGGLEELQKVIAK